MKNTNTQFMVVKRNSNYKPNFSEKGFYLTLLNNKKKYFIEIDITNNDVYINDKLEFGFINNGLSDDDLCLDINLHISQNYFTTK